jgi:hypothetical protein
LFAFRSVDDALRPPSSRGRPGRFAGENESVVVKVDRSRQPVGIGIGAYEHEDRLRGQLNRPAVSADEDLRDRTRLARTPAKVRYALEAAALLAEPTASEARSPGRFSQSL